jgi:hypothetical protein
MGGYFFVSYSRKEFYFTESLLVNLNKRNIATWFDALNLTPGEDWSRTIRDRLEACGGLILIDSKASFASDYVKAEWSQVLSAGKPIFVVMFEAAEVPAELKEAAVFDFRKHFDRKLHELIHHIRYSSGRTDPIPTYNLLRLPTRLPDFVLVTAAVLLGTALVSTAIWILFTYGLLSIYLKWGSGHFMGQHFIEEYLPIIFFGSSSFSLVISIWHIFKTFIRREPNADFNPFLFFALPAMIWYQYRTLGSILDYLDHGGSISLSLSGSHIVPPFDSMWLLVLLIVVSLCDWFVAARLRFSPDALRWTPTGDLPERWRQRLLDSSIDYQSPEAVGYMGVQRTYSLHYNKIDSSVASAVKRVMNSMVISSKSIVLRHQMLAS